MKNEMKPADDEPIGRAILNELLLREAFSPEKAIPGPELRQVINKAQASLKDPRDIQEIEDRAFRAIYCRLPICAGDSGLYIPTKPEHIRAFEDYLKKKALGEFRRIRFVQERRPELGPFRSQIVIDFGGGRSEPLRPPAEEAPKICRTCAGTGKVCLGERRASREMAIDAGDPSLEGQVVEQEYATCPTCHGRRGA
jgi:hypothetical protein